MFEKIKLYDIEHLLCGSGQRGVATKGCRGEHVARYRLPGCYEVDLGSLTTNSSVVAPSLLFAS